MSMVNATSTKDIEWENRVLCSDDACIGTIGENGRCRECGLPYTGELPHNPTNKAAAGASFAEETDKGADMADMNAGAQFMDSHDDEKTSDDEWAQRTLCGDESCIGVIGGDGCCKECGKPGPT